MSGREQQLIPPLEATRVPADWIEMVRVIVARDGHALRAGAQCTIEVQCINQPESWGRLMLPNNGFVFASEADRDVVLAKIWGEGRQHEAGQK